MDNKVHTFTGENAIKELMMLAQGTPVKVRLSESLPWKQTIFMNIISSSTYPGGTANNPGDSVITLFDGSGVTGAFQLSFKFIMNRGIKFKFNDNNPEEVTKLLQMLQR